MPQAKITTMPYPEESDYWKFAHGEKYVNAIRSSGYKNAAMALGELVDNAIQANAKNVTILVIERQNSGASYETFQIEQVAVLDDGDGMDAILLRRSLKLGDGEHFDDEMGMGKYGVGLPQASVSQAKRVDAWSWQNGVKNAYHTYIDLSDPAWVKDMRVPRPELQPIPPQWLKMVNFGKSGTLIVWSKVDRLGWKKASTLFRHSEFLVGRMYRNWLNGKETGYPPVSIKLVAHDDNGQPREKFEFRPNDPLYLMKNTSVKDLLPNGFPNPPFQRWGDPIEKEYVVGKTRGKVKITFSLADKAVRTGVEGTDAGAMPYGKHAKENVGVSIMREGRELELDAAWTSKDPRNRWWGAQVEFGRLFDDIFGVTNNKQHAFRLSDMVDREWADYRLNADEATDQIKKRLEKEDFATFVCLDVATDLRKNIGTLNETIKKNPVRTKGAKRHREDSPEAKGTGATRDRQDEGHAGDSDKEEELSDSDRKKALIKRMKEQGYDDDAIEEVKGALIDHGTKYAFTQRPLGGSESFFSVEMVSGSLLVVLNSEHPAYDDFLRVITEDNFEELDKSQLVERLNQSRDALKLLLEAWARLEDETPGREKHRMMDTRAAWGRMARDFLTFGEDDE